MSSICKPTSTLEEMRQSVSDHFGESKTLIPERENVWKIVSTYTDSPTIGVRVRKRRNRYYVETII